MRKSELKSIIKECLDEIELDERGEGDPNSMDAHGPKVGINKPNLKKQLAIKSKPIKTRDFERTTRTQ